MSARPRDFDRQQHDDLLDSLHADTLAKSLGHRMTVPTPHADIIENLRAIVDSAGELIDDDDALAAQFAIDALTRTADALAAVTAERDQAVENARASQQMHEDARRLLNQTLMERDKLRERLADAPHGETCMSLQGFRKPLGPCDCWKAGL